MGKTNKKAAQKRKISVAAEEDNEHKRSKVEEVPADIVVVEKPKKEKKKEAEPPREEDVDDEEEDEEVSDEDDENSGDDSDDSGGDFIKETGEKVDFDFEAFPLEDEDKEGINNMLTQIFLRADVDLAGLGKALIAQSPLGCVIGPAEDVADEDNATSNVVYGLISMLPEIDRDEKYAKDIFALLRTRAKAVISTVSKEFESVLASANRLGFFVNERMLHFPAAIAPPAFKSLLEDINAMKSPPSHVLYIHKIRVVEDEEAEKEDPVAAVRSTSASGKKKKKGKAEKKRLAAAALASKEIEYDNQEDEILLQLPGGKSVHFDYQCQSDVDPGSKFSLIKKDSITKTPYRRAVIMDVARFKAFLSAVATA